MWMPGTTDLIEPPANDGATAKSRRFHTNMPLSDGSARYVGDPGCVMAVAGDLVNEVPRDHRRVEALLAHRRPHALARHVPAHRVVRRPGPRRVDGSDALPHEDPGAVQALEQRRAQRVLR